MDNEIRWRIHHAAPFGEDCLLIVGERDGHGVTLVATRIIPRSELEDAYVPAVEILIYYLNAMEAELQGAFDSRELQRVY